MAGGSDLSQVKAIFRDGVPWRGMIYANATGVAAAHVVEKSTADGRDRTELVAHVQFYSP
jgi:hypothetical protein